MEGVLSTTDQQSMVSSFLEIAVGQTADTARQFLQLVPHRCATEWKLWEKIVEGSSSFDSFLKADHLVLFEATSWKLEDAIQLFYLGNEGGAAAPSFYPPELENDVPLHDSNLRGLEKDTGDQNGRQVDGDDIRPPLPVKREVLYDNSMLYGSSRMGGLSSEAQPHSIDLFRNFEEEMKRPGVWEVDQGSSSVTNRVPDNLASLYREPFALMFLGPFEKAKDFARMQNKWLVVNIQSTTEFSSHMLNRDTWANEAVAQTIKTNFIFWQVNDDKEEGSKVCTYYKLDSIPVILIIDPITGQKMRSWLGMVQPENLLEDLLPFMDNCPSDHHVSLSHKRPRGISQAPPSDVQVMPDESNEEDAFQRALAASMEAIKGTDEGALKKVDETISEKKETLMKKPAYPPLPEEPKGDRSMLCRVGVRFPDGRRVQRNFLRTDPIQLLWSFCYSELKEADTRPFRLTQAIPGAPNSLDYDSSLTFEQYDLANSMISVTWE